MLVQSSNALNLSTIKFKSFSAGITTRRDCRTRVVTDQLYLACPYDLVGFFHLPFFGWLLDGRRLKSSDNFGFQVQPIYLSSVVFTSSSYWPFNSQWMCSEVELEVATHILPLGAELVVR